MTTITLTPELETALSRRAEIQGTTPELLALNGLRQFYVTPELDESETTQEAGGALFDFLNGYVGTIEGSAEAFSESGGEKFAQGLAGKHNAGKR